ncbi:hypothetical protein THAOC_18819 [Thalassiosira oceanica]|uniref:Deacetylase sirtuin-type domain-containing protein n=1 Tax=Thalassiosira oceanica TaxID=159749 RepID=K0SR32_THAOC|nr:hypothetical protein THAOC_18819 [Thalassiosira oceanica]|eukprot:EJK60772.1 hypothetical protein THAOC_18819 [Thalassiosira oceanica]
MLRSNLRDRDQGRRDFLNRRGKLAEGKSTSGSRTLQILCARARIPDFRTPGSGLYSKLHEYRLPYPEAIFEIDFFRQNSQPFVTLAKEIWPGVKYRPTITHCFFSLLDRKRLLQRLYT